MEFKLNLVLDCETLGDKGVAPILKQANEAAALLKLLNIETNVFIKGVYAGLSQDQHSEELKALVKKYFEEGNSGFIFETPISAIQFDLCKSPDEIIYFVKEALISSFLELSKMQFKATETLASLDRIISEETDIDEILTNDAEFIDVVVPETIDINSNAIIADGFFNDLLDVDANPDIFKVAQFIIDLKKGTNE